LQANKREKVSSKLHHIRQDHIQAKQDQRLTGISSIQHITKQNCIHPEQSKKEEYQQHIQQLIEQDYIQAKCYDRQEISKC
jgi:hypothetical protein